MKDERSTGGVDQIGVEELFPWQYEGALIME